MVHCVYSKQSFQATDCTVCVCWCLCRSDVKSAVSFSYTVSENRDNS